MDIGKQVDYWRNSAAEDWKAAVILVRKHLFRHGLFMAHLAMEKVLKAHVCHSTGDLAPRIHTLTKLADKADLKLSETRRKFLDRFDLYQMEGRYPDPATGDIDDREAEAAMKKAKAMLEWLIIKLGK